MHGSQATIPNGKHYSLYIMLFSIYLLNIAFVPELSTPPVFKNGGRRSGNHTWHGHHMLPCLLSPPTIMYETDLTSLF